MHTNTAIILEAEEQAPKTERKVVMDVRDIRKSLPLGRERIDILKGISFSIMSGEFVSIVGPSGSGKSTLLGIIAGLDNPTTGQVLIDDVDITRMTEGKLDAKNGENVLKLIAELRASTGKTFIIATHDPVVASRADRAIRIVDGRIEEIENSNGRITQ